MPFKFCYCVIHDNLHIFSKYTKNEAQNPVKLFLSLYAFFRKLLGLIVYANAYANADANAMHVIVIVIVIVIIIVIVIANSLCSSKDE